MAWIYLIIAGLFECGWAIGLKYTDGFTRLMPSILTVAAMAISFWLLSTAMKTIPVGTAYAVWTGIGAVGVAIMGMILFGEWRVKTVAASAANKSCVIHTCFQNE